MLAAEVEARAGTLRSSALGMTATDYIFGGAGRFLFGSSSRTQITSEGVHEETANCDGPSVFIPPESEEVYASTATHLPGVGALPKCAAPASAGLMRRSAWSASTGQEGFLLSTKS